MYGLLLVDKPVGPTSHDMVNVVRRRAGLRRVGHTGTLDPIASGLLLLLLGPATKWASVLLQHDKLYDWECLLGIGTETGDTAGRIMAQAPDDWIPPDATRIQCQLQAFLGAQQQTPPMYSAIKHRGQPLYWWARQGRAVVRSPRPIHIHRWELTEYRPPRMRSLTHCSSGTYIRSLAESLGERLGTVAHVSALRRLRVGAYDVHDAVTWDWLTCATPDMLRAQLITRDPRQISPDAAVPCASSQ